MHFSTLPSDYLSRLCKALIETKCSVHPEYHHERSSVSGHSPRCRSSGVLLYHLCQRCAELPRVPDMLMLRCPLPDKRPQRCARSITTTLELAASRIDVIRTAFPQAITSQLLFDGGAGPVRPNTFRPYSGPHISRSRKLMVRNKRRIDETNLEEHMSV